MRGNIVICGLDGFYIEALITYLTLSKKNQFQYFWVQNIEALNNSKYDLCLLDEFMFNLVVDVEEGLKNKPYVLLSEATTMRELELTPVIFKYQKVMYIEELLLKHFMTLTTKEAIHGHKSFTHIIGCYSPSGGAGNTTVGQMVAHIKSRQGYKVFFLSFDIYPVYDDCYASLQESDLTDYMIHLMTKSNWLMALEKMKCIDTISNVHYFKPASSEKDQQDFDQDIWLQWVAYMKEHSDYDYIVLDMATRDLKNNLKIMALCTRIIYTVRNDYFGRLKWRKYSEDIPRLGLEPLLDNGLIVLNSLTPHSEGGELTCHCRLEYDDKLYTLTNEVVRTINNLCPTYKSLEVLLSND